MTHSHAWSMHVTFDTDICKYFCPEKMNIYIYIHICIQTIYIHILGQWHTQRNVTHTHKAMWHTHTKIMRHRLSHPNPLNRKLLEFSPRIFYLRDDSSFGWLLENSSSHAFGWLLEFVSLCLSRADWDTLSPRVRVSVSQSSRLRHSLSSSFLFKGWLLFWMTPRVFYLACYMQLSVSVCVSVCST